MRKFLIIFLQLVLITQFFSIGWFYNLPKAKADSAHCGEILVANFTLTENMTCSGNGLVVGASSITIDATANHYTLTGDGGFDYYGIYNNSDYSSVTIKNFGSISNFSKAIYAPNSTGLNTIENNTI